mmetsp:Transcript_7788/g.13821  ORF Transcript_7788/g.13821 Transcript_7788/m.13821 type:complete len:417 (+) Transcript_7788:53-1303(+)
MASLAFIWSVLTLLSCLQEVAGSKEKNKKKQTPEPLHIESGSCTSADCEKTNANLSSLLKRLEDVEVLMQAKVGTSTDPGSAVLSKEEVYDRFKLFHETNQKELDSFRTELDSIQSKIGGPSASTDLAGSLSKEEIHERFKLFYESSEVELNVVRTQLADVQTSLRHLEEVMAQKPDAVAVMSKQEVHERFRLFHEAMNAPTSPVTGGSLSLKHSEVAIRVAARLESVEERLHRLEAELQESRHRWPFMIGLCVLLLAIYNMLAVASACTRNEERIKVLEAMVAAKAEDDTMSPNGHLDASPEKPTFRTKAISGALGASVGGVTGATVGTAVGGALGAVVGLVPAVFTFGLSVPIGAALGSGLGLTTGTVLGGGTGAFGGVRAVGWLRARDQRQRLAVDESVMSDASFDEKLADEK